MLHKLTTAAALSLAGLLATPASAIVATATVNFGDTTPIPANNDFASQLGALFGLDRYASTGASVILNQRSIITFHYLASESGFTDSFQGGPLAGFAESDGDSFAAPVRIGRAVFEAGPLSTVSFTTSGSSLRAFIGDEAFGLFLRPDAVSGGHHVKLFFGFDDQINNVDDNHDDFIVRATIAAVPEPGTWALMIAGFGLVGFAARRRGTAVVAA